MSDKGDPSAWSTRSVNEETGEEVGVEESLPIFTKWLQIDRAELELGERTQRGELTAAEAREQNPGCTEVDRLGFDAALKEAARLQVITEAAHTLLHNLQGEILRHFPEESQATLERNLRRMGARARELAHAGVESGNGVLH